VGRVWIRIRVRKPQGHTEGQNVNIVGALGSHGVREWSGSNHADSHWMEIYWGYNHVGSPGVWSVIGQDSLSSVSLVRPVPN